MKPVYLEFCGVNSFSEKAVVDFRKLFSNGVFGIFGDTGSGKSTILDCIQLALYGTIDRSSENDCINRKCAGFYVTYDFELLTDGVRRTFRVRRERTRKSSNNTKAILYEFTDDGGLLSLAEGTRDVNAVLGNLIGLNVTDFKMCIALPQGEFAGLVKAKPTERLALVSRLFDLSKYGERLKSYLKEKCDKASMAVTIVETQLNSLEDCSEERKIETETRLNERKTLLLEKENRYLSVEKELSNVESLLAEKTAYETCLKELEKAEKSLPVYEKKRVLLERYPVLKEITEKYEDYENANRERRETETSLQNASLAFENAKTELDRVKSELERENFEEKIQEISRILGRFENAKADVETYKNAEEELLKSRAEYASIKSVIKKEPFDEMIAELTQKIEALGGEETVVEYVKKYLKDSILLDGYAEIRKDLNFLKEKYPETTNDVEKLLQKYLLPKQECGAGSFDIEKAEREFKEIERERKLYKERLISIEKLKKLNEENESKLRIVEEKGKVLKTSFEAAKAKLATLEKDGTFEEVTERFERLKALKKRAEERLQSAQNAERNALSAMEKYGALKKRSEETYQTAKVSFETALKGSGFLEMEEVKKELSLLGDERATRAECDRFFSEYNALQKQLERVDVSRFEKVSVATVYALKADKQALNEEKKQLGIEIGRIESELKKLEETREKYAELSKEYAEKKKTSELWERLRACVSGRRADKTLMDFIATEYLQDVCVSAGKTLLSLTGGRYFLRYQGGEFFVGDNLDGGELRLVKTLSGGETFLVSLSLALSLSAAICQKSLRPIEFFFLDEGFGTLDGKLVETVMDVLGRLSKSFTIGLISHVEELKQRIPNKILVSGATETHGSQLRMETF
ncbi:MAG: SMC family ATPase [Clostridia bacterium]|nr:SMC family ATPase [Clostridia bacterium]